MNAHYIALAIPLFLLLIGIELRVSRRQKEPRYTFHDAIASMGCGIGQQVLELVFSGLSLGSYVLAYQHLRIASLALDSPWVWIAALLTVDLAYYLYHRASHRINILWATHIVHHQSEEYNLSTALRQSWFTGLTSWIFYLPLAVLGFPPAIFIASYTINLLYQFWIHTRTVGRLGWVEWVLNTPSHHRVHHGVEPRYIDKNYGGILIIWDRLFGTFAAEGDEPVYGTVEPLRSFNPIWANIEHWIALWRCARATQRWRDKLRIWLMPPEWRPADLGGAVQLPPVSRAAQRKYHVTSPPGVDGYVAMSFALTVTGTTALLWVAGTLSIPQLMASILIVVATVGTWGGLLESRAWAIPLELVRLWATAALLAWLAWDTTMLVPVLTGALLANIGMSMWLIRCRIPLHTPAV